MPNTPLDSHIQAGARKRAGNTRTLKLIAGGLVLAMVPVFGATLAANVNLNNGAPIEFGQGSQTTIACDTSVGTAINEQWSAAEDYFVVTTLELNTLDTALNATNLLNGGCGARTLKLSLMDVDGNPLAIGSGGELYVTVVVPTTNGSATANQGATATIAGLGVGDTEGTLTVTINPATPLSAANVYRIALESSY